MGPDAARAGRTAPAEAGPALDICANASAATGRGGGTAIAADRQAARLGEDLAAMDAQARRLSPRTLRQLVGFGGRAARFMDRLREGGKMTQDDGAERDAYKVNSLTASTASIPWTAWCAGIRRARCGTPACCSARSCSRRCRLGCRCGVPRTVCGHVVHGPFGRLPSPAHPPQLPVPEVARTPADWMGTVVGMGGPIWTIRTHDTRDWAQRQPACHGFLRHAKPC